MAFNLFMYNNSESEESIQENRGTSSFITRREMQEIQEKFHREKLIYEENNKCLMSEEKKAALHRRNLNPPKKENQEIIDEVYKEVKNRYILSDNICAMNTWNHHIEIAYQYTTKNYEKYAAKYDIVALVSLLYQLSCTTETQDDEKHIVIEKLVEKLLGKYALDKDSLDLIKNCLLNYQNGVIKTPEEICIKDSNIIPVFYNIPAFFKIAYAEKNMELEEGREFVLDKIDTNFNNLSNKGKDIIFDEYKRARILLMQSK